MHHAYAVSCQSLQLLHGQRNHECLSYIPPSLVAAGNSVCVFVHGFEPYFYCDCPPNWSPEDCQELVYALRVGSRDSSLLRSANSSRVRSMKASELQVDIQPARPVEQ
eukprot:GHUV01035804.1.p1 GENE.GHUV01035804.1~~GHUV01035804.1.p1  ORF type:complete len:108 (-),score=14.96 GHUV01035804.1:561-884(-)